MIVESKIEKYYSGSYFSESVAGLLYNLSRQLNQDSYSFLWYWILGCTEMFVDKKIDMKTYESVYVSCKFEKNRFKTKDNNLSKSRK